MSRPRFVARLAAYERAEMGLAEDFADSRLGGWAGVVIEALWLGGIVMVVGLGLIARVLIDE